MAEGIAAVTSALQAMKDGSGDFEAVRAAVEAARFDARPVHRLGDSPDRVRSPGSFEDVVTPWTVRGVISREQWRELVAIWKSRPPASPAADELDPRPLRYACQHWQSGRDGGSSRLRGAARALTGVDHYFRAAFITEHEQRARVYLGYMRDAAVLLRAVEAAPLRDADGWNAALGLPLRGFAGRGLQAKPDVEAEMLEHIGSGRLVMPLWVSPSIRT